MTRAKRLVGIYSDPADHNILRYPNGYTVHYVMAVYEIEYMSGEIAVSSETQKLATGLSPRCLTASQPRLGNGFLIRWQTRWLRLASDR